MNTGRASFSNARVPGVRTCPQGIPE